MASSLPLPITPDGPSALYVFEISRQGKLLRSTRLMASDATGADGFGLAAALALDTIVVGAPNAEAVYIFRRQGTQWVERKKLVPAGGEQGGAFGSTVAIDRGLILVGTPDAKHIGGASSGFEAGGFVYAFERVNEVWTQRSKFRPSINQFSHYKDFGRDIVMFGERAVISAAETLTPSDAVQPNVVFEYERTAQGLKATSLGRSPSLGGMALFNNILILGSPRESKDSAIGHATIYNLSTPVH